jgi:Fusaric acid resistance protein-like
VVALPRIARISVVDPGRFALKAALRAAIVMPTAFALSLAVLGNKQMALFASFGSMALLVFVDFGGPWRLRLRAYLVLFMAGAALVVIGTLCSRSAWLATLSMALIGFAILFAGVLDAYVAAAHASATLAFVLAVMVPAGAVAIPSRLAGWGIAGALCIPAALLSVANRPSGTSGPTAALARLIADLGWLVQLADLQHAFWIVLGTMSVLRSNAFSTGSRIASALLGTLAGIILGGLVVALVGSHVGLLWAVLPVAVLLAAYAQAVSFAAGQAAFTIVVLVLFNLIEPVGWKVGLVRVEDVAAARVVLDRPGTADGPPPGLAIAWAHRHLEMLGELEPLLASAAERIIAPAQ